MNSLKNTILMYIGVAIIMCSTYKVYWWAQDKETHMLVIYLSTFILGQVMLINYSHKKDNKYMFIDKLIQSIIAMISGVTMAYHQETAIDNILVINIMSLILLIILIFKETKQQIQ